MWTGWIAWFKLLDFVLLVDGGLAIDRNRPGDFQISAFLYFLKQVLISDSTAIHVCRLSKRGYLVLDTSYQRTVI